MVPRARTSRDHPGLVRPFGPGQQRGLWWSRFDVYSRGQPSAGGGRRPLVSISMVRCDGGTRPGGELAIIAGCQPAVRGSKPRRGATNENKEQTTKNKTEAVYLFFVLGR